MSAAKIEEWSEETLKKIQKQVVVLGRLPAEPGWRFLSISTPDTLKPVTHWAVLSSRKATQAIDLFGGSGYQQLAGMLGFGGSSPHTRFIPCDGEKIVWDVIEVSPPDETDAEMIERVLAYQAEVLRAKAKADEQAVEHEARMAEYRRTAPAKKEKP